MDTGVALRRAIADEPAEDLQRLAYADWLDEQPVSRESVSRWRWRWPPFRKATTDGARAEFIRLQVAAASMAKEDSRKVAFETRAATLLAAYQSAWEKSLRETYVRGLRRVEWSRGFVRSIELTAASLLADPKGRFAEHPIETLRVVALHCGQVQALARYPHLSRIVTLDLGGSPLREVDIWSLAAATGPVNLRVLIVGQGHVEDAIRFLSITPTLRDIAIRTKAPPPLPNLEQVNNLDLSMWLPGVDAKYDFARKGWVPRNRPRGSMSSAIEVIR